MCGAFAERLIFILFHSFVLQCKNENEELSALLVVTRETQNELAVELTDLKDRYAEVLGLLQETQETLKKQNKKGIPSVRGGGLFSSLQSSIMSSSLHPESLGTELECSLFSELSLDSGISSDRTYVLISTSSLPRVIRYRRLRFTRIRTISVSQFRIRRPECIPPFSPLLSILKLMKFAFHSLSYSYV